MEMIGYVNQEKGLTLVEVIASIVLISIILLSFMGIFMQSNKTTATSGDIVNATYMAQIEMENIYKNRIYNTPEEIVNKLNEQSQSATPSEPEYVGNLNSWEKQKDNKKIKLKMEKDNVYPELTTIVIEVYEKVNGTETLKSKIENRYKLGG